MGLGHVSSHCPSLWPMAAPDGLRCTSVQELFETKLEPAIQSITLALISYSNVHLVVGDIMHIPFMTTNTDEVDIRIAH